MKIKIGIDTMLWTWPFNSKNLDIFSKIKSFGYNIVEFGIDNFSDDNLDNIKESLKNNNLESILNSPFVVGNLLSDDKIENDKAIAFMKKSIDVCQYFGSAMLVGPLYGSGINRDFLDKNIKSIAKNHCVELLKYVARYALEKKVKLAIEPLNRYESNFINTTEECLDLIRLINMENVGIMLDTYHMNIEEKDIKKAILNTNALLMLMHVPENDRGTPGTGHIPWEDIAEALKIINFDGYLIIESGSPNVRSVAVLGAFWRKYDYVEDEMAKKGLEFLENCFK